LSHLLLGEYYAEEFSMNLNWKHQTQHRICKSPKEAKIPQLFLCLRDGDPHDKPYVISAQPLLSLVLPMPLQKNPAPLLTSSYEMVIGSVLKHKALKMHSCSHGKQRRKVLVWEHPQSATNTIGVWQQPSPAAFKISQTGAAICCTAC